VQTTEKPNRKLDLGKTLSTRNGTLLVSAITAVLAAALLLIFLSQYRESTQEDGLTASVLVAKRLIERGSPGDALADQGMFQRVSVPRSDLKQGALTDPESIKGQTAAVDIYPGEQLTTADFAIGATRVQDRLGPGDRAIAIPVDAVHGNTGQLKAGDRVDVLGGFNVGDNGNGDGGKPVIKPMLRNVLVLSAPGGAASGGTGTQDTNVVLRAPDRKAAELAFSADHGKLWLLLRPQVGARDSDISMITLETVLFGVKPVNLAPQAQGGQ
jgi:pilus assembly protein CpaB